MKVLAIDPGTTDSAFVLYDCAGRVDWHDKIGNVELLRHLYEWEFPNETRLVIEQVACYGQPVGKDVFETVFWCGRFFEAAVQRECFAALPVCIVRNEVRKHLCFKVVGINDSILRQRLIDRFGPGKDKAIGKKKTPGPLFGISGDEWQALALAVVYADQLQGKLVTA